MRCIMSRANVIGVSRQHSAQIYSPFYGLVLLLLRPLLVGPCHYLTPFDVWSI